METQFINLNMTPMGITPCFHVSQYDIGRPLGFMIYNGSEVVDLDSYTCTIEATRSDGVAITASVATDDNVGTFETTATMTNKADKYKAQFVIVDGDSNRIASLPFDMDVCKAAMDENSEAIEEDASLYQQYTEAVQSAIAEANADIQAEENARIAAINAEATARANADTTLQNNINAEATARQTADNTLQGNINSEASARQAADSNLQSQINQIIAPSGEAPSAAEVQNARIGADGVTYDTLGNAIRGQITDLKKTINYSNIGEEVLKCDYELGDIDSSGQDSGSSKRVRSVFQISYDNDIIINCAEGYRFRLYRYNPDGTLIGRGGDTYRTGRCMVEKATLFRVVINTVEGSNPVTLSGARSALTITSYIQTEIDTNALNIIDNDLKTRGFALIKGGWEYGDIDNGYLTNTVNRIRSASDVTYERDIKIHASNGYWVGIYGVNEDGTYYPYYNPWITTMFKIPAGVTFRAIIRSESGGEIQSVAEAVANIYVDYDEDCLPSYWTDNNYLKDKIDLINSNGASVVDGTQFAFFTDAHIPANDGYSKELLNKVYELTSVNMGVFGGDIMTAYGTRADVVKTANKWLNYVRKIKMPLLQVHGNHDWTCKTSANENTGYTENKAFTNYYSFNCMKFNNIKRNLTNRYYILTDDIHKIVYLVWDDFYVTHEGANPWGVQAWVDANQVRWFRNALLEVPENYNVISFSHAPINSDIRGYSAPNTLIQQILVGYKNKTSGTATYQNESVIFDFTNAKGNFVCHIAGHCHTDESSTENGILCITTTCDAVYNDDPNSAQRITGTTTAQAIDIYTVNTETKTINTVRIGGGIDNRSFNYS